MLLGVVLHAAVSTMRRPPPGLLWAVHDRATTPLCDWLFWWIHTFRMPLFFLLAGFFTVQLYDSRGPAGYLLQRCRRLLLPFAWAVLLVLPLTLAVWCGGWLSTGLCTWNDVRRWDFAPAIRHQMYGPAHLWFLEYLFVICVAYAGLRWLCPGWFSAGRLGDWLLSPWRSLVLAVPPAGLVLIDPGLLTAFHNSYLPDPLRLLYYGYYFLAGTWLYRVRHRLDELTPRCPRLLAPSVPLFAVVMGLLPGCLEGRLPVWGRLALALSATLAAWLSVFGFLGLFLRCCRRERPWLRLLADASYWIYLVHLPLVGLCQVLLARVPVQAAVKFVLATAATSALGLLTYRWWVRDRFLGVVLNGAKPARGRPLPATSRAA
jgi:peptidoglycan/LPS O-acetylase OafA/YrhL